MNASDPKSGSTPLIWACRRRDHPNLAAARLRSGPCFEVVNLLLHYGANPNGRDNHNRTALHYACRNEPKLSGGFYKFLKVFALIFSTRKIKFEFHIGNPFVEEQWLHLAA